MFDVKEKNNNNLLKVFSVKEDTNGITRFLIYRNNKWEWVLSTNFEPVFIDLNTIIQKAYKDNMQFLAEKQKEIDGILKERSENDA